MISTTLGIISIVYSVVVLGLGGFLWRLQVQVNKLSYDNHQHKSEIVEFKKKNVDQDRDINDLEKSKIGMEKDIKHIIEGVDDIKDMLKIIIDNKTKE